jgi:hypothetical protein
VKAENGDDVTAGCKGIRSMRNLVVLFTFLACCGAASAQEHKTYRCKIADVVTVTADGRLRIDGGADSSAMRSLYDGAIIDTLTGGVTYADGRRRVWKVTHVEGMGDNYYTLTEGPAAAAIAPFFVRVRASKGDTIVRLIVFVSDTLASGPCEVVR